MNFLEQLAYDLQGLPRFEAGLYWSKVPAMIASAGPPRRLGLRCAGSRQKKGPHLSFFGEKGGWELASKFIRRSDIDRDSDRDENVIYLLTLIYKSGGLSPRLLHCAFQGLAS